MSRKIPEFQSGHYYHIYNRGADRKPIFFEKENYTFLLRRIKKYIQRFSISMIAYCLMPNHYHFLVRQDADKKAGKCNQYLFNSYTKAINKRYERSGTLFEGPYRAIHVDDESYLIHLCRYIHRNPLEAKLEEKPGEWPYSNYLEWIGRRAGTLVEAQFVKQYFPASQEYIRFFHRADPSSGFDKYLFE